MIISVEKLKEYEQFKDLDERELKDKLDGLESLIRSYTNNNFQNRNIRFYAPSANNKLLIQSSLLRVGDTLQITHSAYNDGLYVIEQIDDEGLTLDGSLYDAENQTVTKIEYPKAVVSTVINILSWEAKYGSKMGIQSESIGRHSVSYFNQSENNSLGGYPLALFNPLNQFKKARF